MIRAVIQREVPILDVKGFRLGGLLLEKLLLLLSLFLALRGLDLNRDR